METQNNTNSAKVFTVGIKIVKMVVNMGRKAKLARNIRKHTVEKINADLVAYSNYKLFQNIQY